jgi:hypothetical protein
MIMSFSTIDELCSSSDEMSLSHIRAIVGHSMSANIKHIIDSNGEPLPKTYYCASLKSAAKEFKEHRAVDQVQFIARVMYGGPIINAIRDTGFKVATLLVILGNLLGATLTLVGNSSSAGAFALAEDSAGWVKTIGWNILAYHLLALAVDKFRDKAKSVIKRKDREHLARIQAVPPSALPRAHADLYAELTKTDLSISDMRKMLVETIPDADFRVVMSPSGVLHDKDQILRAFVSYVQ